MNIKQIFRFKKSHSKRELINEISRLVIENRILQDKLEGNKNGKK